MTALWVETILTLIYRGRNIYKAGDIKKSCWILNPVKWQGKDLNPGKDLWIQWVCIVLDSVR